MSTSTTQASTDITERLASLRSARAAEMGRWEAANERHMQATDAHEKAAAWSEMESCNEPLSRIHSEIIEVLPLSGLQFELQQAFDGEGQDGKVSRCQVPPGALHSHVRDRAVAYGFAPGYADIIVEVALGSAVEGKERTELFKAETSYWGDGEVYEVYERPTLTLLISQGQ